MAKENSSRQNRDRTCCGVVQEAASKSRAKSEARRNKPQPWIALKIAVVFTFGIMCYAVYVYVARFCVKMIRDGRGELGGRGVGIAFVTIFSVLWVMMMWAYVMVVFVGPGRAKDYVQPSPEPPLQNVVPHYWPSDTDISGGPYVPEVPPPAHISSSTGSVEQPMNGHHEKNYSQPQGQPLQQDPNVGVIDTFPPVQHGQVMAAENTREQQQQQPTNGAPPSSQKPMIYQRKPSARPVLRPETRYCYKDGFVKPLRAHHCRACGTCILKYDHHCPWIGQCVGAHNHKYFVNFLQWALLFCAWTFGTLLAEVIKRTHDPNGDLDPQEIVILALSALFLLFTVTLLATHIRLIVFNQTTVEHMYQQSMEERESHNLSKLYACYQFGEKRKLKKQWNAEWGRMTTEGNLWWLGSTRKNWEYIMGPSVWQWFLPIPGTQGDGLNYPTNPRFDAEGRWLPRREWPQELQ